ncbi:hypothetical protein Tco_0739572 [Tanacetum coccineum]
MLNYMEKMEKHSLLMAIDSNYIMKKKTIMTKEKQSLPSVPKNELQKSPTQASAVPPPDVPLPYRRSSLPPLDTTTKDIISEFIIPEATTTVAPVRRVGSCDEEAQIAILWGLLGIYRVRIADLEFQAKDRLEQCERGWIHDMARIRRLEGYLGIGQ